VLTFGNVLFIFLHYSPRTFVHHLAPVHVDGATRNHNLRAERRCESKRGTASSKVRPHSDVIDVEAVAEWRVIEKRNRSGCSSGHDGRARLLERPSRSAVLRCARGLRKVRHPGRRWRHVGIDQREAIDDRRRRVDVLRIGAWQSSVCRERRKPLLDERFGIANHDHSSEQYSKTWFGSHPTRRTHS
jgi:hypothetical protein